MGWWLWAASAGDKGRRTWQPLVHPPAMLRHLVLGRRFQCWGGGQAHGTTSEAFCLEQKQCLHDQVKFRICSVAHPVCTRTLFYVGTITAWSYTSASPQKPMDWRDILPVLMAHTGLLEGVAVGFQHSKGGEGRLVEGGRENFSSVC